MKTLLIWPITYLGHDLELVAEGDGSAFFFNRSKFSQEVRNSSVRMMEEIHYGYPSDYRYPVDIPVTLYLTLREKADKLDSVGYLSEKEEHAVDRQILQLFNNQVAPLILTPSPQ